MDRVKQVSMHRDYLTGKLRRFVHHDQFATAADGSAYAIWKVIVYLQGVLMLFPLTPLRAVCHMGTGTRSEVFNGTWQARTRTKGPGFPSSVALTGRWTTRHRQVPLYTLHGCRWGNEV